MLIDVTITKPCGNSSLDRSARQSGYAVREVAAVKNNTYRGTLTATSYQLVPLAVLTCGEIGLAAQREGSSERLAEGNYRRVWICRR